MQIAICDDNKEFRDILRKDIMEYKQEKKINISVTEFENGETLLESKEKYDMIFLDYVMKDGADGFEIAKEIRKRNINSGIVFVTAYPEFVYDSFAVQPFRFIVKPVEKEKLTEALDSFISGMKQIMPITIIENGRRISLRSDEIIYIEAEGKCSNIITAEHKYHSSYTLSKLSGMLPGNCFFRIHKSFVVNLFFVTMIEGREITMSDGTKVPVSRIKSKEFKKKYTAFVKENYMRV